MLHKFYHKKKQLIFPNSLLLLPEIVALFPNSLVYTFKKVGESFHLLPPTLNNPRHNHGNMYTLIPVYSYSFIHSHI